MDTIPEESTFDLGVAFLDPAGVPAVPASVLWSVYDYNTATELVPETAFAVPASSIEIPIPVEATTIIDDTMQDETHMVIVKTTFAGSKVLNGRFLFKVLNLQHVP